MTNLEQNWQHGQDFKAPPHWQQQQGAGFGGGCQADSGQYSDFFEELFGGGFSRQARPQRGQDVHSKLDVTLQDAYNGSTMTVQVGSRALKIKIPAGISNGQQIRLKGQGGDGSGGGQKGDLLVEIHLKADPLYRLEQKNIILTLPLTPWEAALGASIAVPTLSGKVQMKIPAGSQSGQKLRLKGKGFPGKPAGDQVVELQVVLPLADTERAKNLYDQMAKNCPIDPRAHMAT